MEIGDTIKMKIELKLCQFSHNATKQEMKKNCNKHANQDIIWQYNFCGEQFSLESA